MPIFILYFLAAGAAGIGGPAIGAAFLKRGQQSRAAYLRQEEIDEISRLLVSEVNLAQLRREAAEAGVDPALVERGYYELRDGNVTVEEIAAKLAQWSEQ